MIGGDPKDESDKQISTVMSETLKVISNVVSEVAMVTPVMIATEMNHQ